MPWLSNIASTFDHRGFIRIPNAAPFCTVTIETARNIPQGITLLTVYTLGALFELRVFAALLAFLLIFLGDAVLYSLSCSVNSRSPTS